jgi:hypothetical protein
MASVLGVTIHAETNRKAITRKIDPKYLALFIASSLSTNSKVDRRDNKL